MIFLDTSCFIYLFERNPELAPKLVPIFDSISTSTKPFYTSNITLAETITKQYETKDMESANKYLEIFQHTPNLTLLYPTLTSSVVAAQIRAEYKFSLLDSFQLALAQEAKCKFFYTNDKQLTKFKSLKIQLISNL